MSQKPELKVGAGEGSAVASHYREGLYGFPGGGGAGAVIGVIDGFV